MLGRELSPGTILNERYRIIRVVGSGGMGTVYQAQHLRLDTVVAVKEIRGQNTETEAYKQALAMCEQEARFLVRLTHPHLPKVTDAFIESDRFYLVMEFLEGESLEALLLRGGCTPLDAALVVDWATQIADVLRYLHSQQPPIIFRDVKPANAILQPDGNVRLIDFGIARRFDNQASKDTALYGSMGYSPPEQFGRAQTDLRSDIYAFGASIHQLVTGRDPAVQPFNFPPAHLLNPSVPQSLSNLIARCVSLEPDMRPASVDEVLAGLIAVRQELALAKPPIEAPRPETPVEHWSLPGPRERRALSRGAVMGIATLALAAALGAWAYLWTRPRPATATRRDIVAEVTAGGSVFVPAAASTDVYAPLRAMVNRVGAAAGSQVTRGQTILQMTAPDARGAVQLARADLVNAQTALQDARADFTQPVAIARKRLAEVNAARRPDVGLQPGSSGAPQADSPPNGDTSTSIRAAQDDVQRAVADRDAQLLPYMQRVAAAREALRQALHGQSIGQVRAPASGYLLEMNARTGEVPGGTPQTPIAVIANLGALEVQAQIPTTPRQSVRTGMRAALTFDTVPPIRVRGSVVGLKSVVIPQIGGLLKSTRRLAVVAFANPRGAIKPGMTAQLVIHVGTARHVVAVPAGALQTDDTGRDIVRVLRHGDFVPVPVRAGLSDGTYVEISKGLKQGDIVQVTPALLTWRR